MNEIAKNNHDLLNSIVELINNSRKRVAVNVNNELTLLYWNIGKEINENILQNKRADYGKQLILGMFSNKQEGYTHWIKVDLPEHIKMTGKGWE